MEDSVALRRIAACIECELPLPLLRPEKPSAGEAWVCSYCGCHYNAIVDESASEDLRKNVRRVDPAT